MMNKAEWAPAEGIGFAAKPNVILKKNHYEGHKYWMIKSKQHIHHITNIKDLSVNMQQFTSPKNHE